MLEDHEVTYIRKNSDKYMSTVSMGEYLIMRMETADGDFIKISGPRNRPTLFEPDDIRRNVRNIWKFK